MNSEIHSINTRYNSDFHRPLVNVTVYKNETYCTGIKVFNYLPTHIKNLSHNVNQFRLALRDFLHFHSFYTLEEYFNSSNNLWTCMLVKYIDLVKTLPSNKLFFLINGSILKYTSMSPVLNNSILYRMHIFCNYYTLFNVVL